MSKSQVYVSRGPKRSHNQPTTSRATIVMATEPITHQPICSFEKCISSRTTDISGAMPNHAKKHRKKAIHDMWNARICGVANDSREMRVALSFVAMADSQFSQRMNVAGAVRHGPELHR